jgi:hypothetical protein
MKLDKNLLWIFMLPVLTVILCISYPHVFRQNKTISLEQPEFLTYVDKLSIFTLKADSDFAANDIKDVFRHEWTLPLNSLYETPPVTAVADPVKVSMIVEAGRQSYCIINGKKMRLGDTTESFRITSIGPDQVITTYKNGTRETHHVKVY